MVCYKCGEELPEGVRFCTSCGADLSQAPAAAAEAVAEAVAGGQETAERAYETVKTEAQTAYETVRTEAAQTAEAYQQAYQQPYQQQAYQQPYQQQTYQQPYQQQAYQQTYQQPYQGAYAAGAAGVAAAAAQPAADPKAQKAAAQAAKKQAQQAQSPIVSTGAFFWLSILYTVPVIGFIVMLIMNFAAKNLNLRHFARSYFIKFIIAMVIMIIFGITAYALRDVIAAAFGFTWEEILNAIESVK